MEKNQTENTPTVPISVTMIVKNCRRGLKRALKSLKGFLRQGDEVVVVDTGSTDGTPSCARAEGARVICRPDLSKPEMVDLARKLCPEESAQYLDDPQFEGGWLSDFAEARQVALAAAKNDICFWMDADDTLHGGAELRKGIDLHFAKKGSAMLFLRYDYAHDSHDGVCTTVLWRERAFDRRLVHWRGRCHETLIPINGLNSVAGKLVKVDIPTISIRHEPDLRNSAGFSDLRNYTILSREYEETRKNPDPRTLYYLGNAARGLKRFRECIKWYKLAIDMSGSSDDRFSMALNVGIAYVILKRPWKALQWGQRASRIKPFDARAYYLMARTYYDMRRWRECIMWTDVGRGLPDAPQGLYSADPQSYDFYPTYFAAESYKELGEGQRALQEARRLVSLRPDLQQARDHLEALQSWEARRRRAHHVTMALQECRDRESQIELSQRIRSPEILEDFGVGRLETEIYAPDGKRDIAILCGNSHEAWGPRSLETGIGGSERMVIEMAPRLAARGRAVTVYSNVPADQRGIVRGVKWAHYTEMDPRLPRDTLLIWRSPQSLEMPVAARRRVVWMHDVSSNDLWTPARVALADKVLVLSPWHRTCFPSVPDDKIFVTGNGIDSERIAQQLAAKRDPKKIIYSSSPDRALVQTLEAFRYARGEDPELTLDILYGFTPFYYRMAAANEYCYIASQNRQRHMVEYADEIQEEIENTPGATLVGRVPCAEVTERMASAGIFLYPTPFTETFCIAAAEAQACGLVCVVSDVAGLASTVLPGEHRIVVKPGDLTSTIRAVMKARTVPADAPLRLDISRRALDRFSLDALADNWMEHIFSE